MADNFKHIRFFREEPVNTRRGRPFPRSLPTPDDTRAHGKKMLDDLKETIRKAGDEVVGGFDERVLLKVQVAKGLQAEDLVRLGIEVISQESEHVILAFADHARLMDFEARLSTIMRGAEAQRQDLFYAMEAFDNWTAEDRTGGALRREGFPDGASFVLDVELWPLETTADRDRLVRAFREFLAASDIPLLDIINRPSLVMVRVRVNRAQADLLMRHRDVRTVDLPPQYGFSQTIIGTDIDEFPQIPAPPADAPGLVVLDSGVQTNHPLLAPAIGDAQNFMDDDGGPEDLKGHGTAVAGIGLYGDLHRCITARQLAPTFKIFSGRVLDENGVNDTGFLENQIDAAVTYFIEQYGCRVFNLSIGDRRKPYEGGHVRGLAVTLDEIARERGVLFIVSAGNFEGTEDGPGDWVGEYPEYLTCDDARLLDPGTALNVLTVGSLARWDQAFTMQRYPLDPNHRPVARRGQPSPFTRCGPTVNGAIKPELVDFGGNKYVKVPFGNDITFDDGLGELTTVRTDLGRLVGATCGTSFAAPHVSHHATAFLAEYPDASSDLLRAVLVANARHSGPSKDLYATSAPDRLRVCGYGQIQEGTFLRSTQNEVTLWTEDLIENKQHHFYELPVPPEFFSPGRRQRELTVALAYTPPVRTTRINYRASRMFFHLVEADNIQEVLNAFNRETSSDDFENIAEFSGNRMVSSRDRNKGTVQCSTWTFLQPSEARRQKKFFVVVTRNDYAWGTDLCVPRERYALVATLRDREAAEAKLYNAVSQRVSQRVQQHQQNRIRL